MCDCTHSPAVLEVVKGRGGKPLFSHTSPTAGGSRGWGAYLTTAEGPRIREEERWMVEGNVSRVLQEKGVRD